MLSIVILICAATVDRADCTARTALIVTNAPATSSADGCGLEAQSMIASMITLEHGDYIKVLCRHGGGRSVDQASLSANKPAAR